MALGRFVSRAAPQGEIRALQITPWGDWGSGAGQAASGMQVSSDTATNLLAVYGCVSLISDTIAETPRCLYRSNGNGTKTELDVHPSWMDQPNDHTDGENFIGQTLVSLLLDGNAYWTYTVDRNLNPSGLYVVDPKRVDVRSLNGLTTEDNGSGAVYLIDGQVFRGRLLHLKGITRPGALKAMSPVEAARQSVGNGLAGQIYAGRFFSNHTTMAGVIETPVDLTLDQAKDLAQKFSRDHGGVDNAWKPGVLDNGASWKSISVTPEQAQFLQSREFTAAEIAAQMFLLDPAMLGIAINRGQNITYGNLEDRGVHLVKFTLRRWARRLERAYTYLLPKPQMMKFDMDDLQRADLETRGKYAQMSLGGDRGMGVPWQTRDEVRGELFDLDPMPDSAFPSQPPAAAPTTATPVPPTNGQKPQPAQPVNS